MVLERVFNDVLNVIISIAIDTLTLKKWKDKNSSYKHIGHLMYIYNVYICILYIYIWMNRSTKRFVFLKNLFIYFVLTYEYVSSIYDTRPCEWGIQWDLNSLMFEVSYMFSDESNQPFILKYLFLSLDQQRKKFLHIYMYIYMYIYIYIYIRNITTVHKRVPKDEMCTLFHYKPNIKGYKNNLSLWVFNAV